MAWGILFWATMIAKGGILIMDWANNDRVLVILKIDMGRKEIGALESGDRAFQSFWNRGCKNTCVAFARRYSEVRI